LLITQTIDFPSGESCGSETEAMRKCVVRFDPPLRRPFREQAAREKPM